MEYSERLQEVARKKGIEQADIARATKTSTSTVSKWWNGKITPGAKNTKMLADFLNCRYEWLRYGEGQMENDLSPITKQKYAVFKAEGEDNLPTELEQLMTWINAQDDGRNYWAWLETEFSEKFSDYKDWLKELRQEKKQKTGTDI